MGLVREFPDSAGVEPGAEGQSEKLLAWLSTWERWRVEVEEYRTNGDYVVALTRYIGRGKGSVVDVDTPRAHLVDGQGRPRPSAWSSSRTASGRWRPPVGKPS